MAGRPLDDDEVNSPPEFTYDLSETSPEARRRGPRHRDYAIAMGLITGQSPAELAKAHGVELTYVLTDSRVIEAEKRLAHMHKYGPSAARGVLLDALPEALQALICVAGDPGHKGWAVAMKLYLDRVLPVIEQSHVYHSHSVDAGAKEAIATASASLAKLVDHLAPMAIEMTATRDITARVLRGDAARPTSIALPETTDG